MAALENSSIKTPAYYERWVYDKSGAPRLIEVFEIADAWVLDSMKAQAIQYILRSSYKEDEIKDLRKAIDCLEHRLLYLERLNERVFSDKKKSSLGEKGVV